MKETQNHFQLFIAALHPELDEAPAGGVLTLCAERTPSRVEGEPWPEWSQVSQVHWSEEKFEFAALATEGGLGCGMIMTDHANGSQYNFWFEKDSLSVTGRFSRLGGERTELRLRTVRQTPTKLDGQPIIAANWKSAGVEFGLVAVSGTARGCYIGDEATGCRYLVFFDGAAERASAVLERPEEGTGRA